MAAAHRRQWKMRALKALSLNHRIEISTVRRTIGPRQFKDLLDDAFAQSPTDAERGAALIHRALHERFGTQLEKPTVLWERK